MLKKILANPLIRSLLGAKTIMIIIAAVALVAIIWVIFAKRKKKKAPEEAADPEDVAGPPPLHLSRIWKTFHKQIPRLYRPGISLFQPFVVLGEAGVGKSAFIDRCTDWRGHASQFYPSYVDDPLLQIYQGSQAVVQELSATVLQDSTARARKALTDLWKPLRLDRPPKVVVVLSAAKLLRSSPDMVIRSAQAVRGKINLLSEILRQPVETHLVLTQLDQIKGFLELSGILREHGKSAQIRIPRDEPELDLSRACDVFEAYLPSVLAYRSASDYLKVLTFLQSVPTVMGPLSAFVRTLVRPDPLSDPPRLDKVALTSSKEPGKPLWNPLSGMLTAEQARRYRPGRRHLWAAGAIAVAGAAWLLSGYAIERGFTKDAMGKVDAVLAQPKNAAARAALFDFLSDTRGSISHALLPRFFPSDPVFVQASVREHYVEGIRHALLMPKLARYEREQDGSAGLYLTSLLYASRDGALGQYVLQHGEQWQGALKLPAAIVSDYVKYNGAPAPPPKMDPRDLVRKFSVPVQADLSGAGRFLGQLQWALSEPFLTPDQLSNLQSLALVALHDARAWGRRDDLLHIGDLLEKQSGIDLRAGIRGMTVPAKADPTEIEQLASMVGQADLDEPEMRSVDLEGLMPSLVHLATPPPSAKPTPDLEFTFDGQSYTIDADAWTPLITKSRATLLLRDFARAHGGDPVGTFFAHPDTYPELSVVSPPHGCAFAPGGNRVNGVFTDQAFEDRISPAVKKLPGLLAKLPVSAEEKRRFSTFVSGALNDYAGRYVGEYRSLYRAFRCRAVSGQDLDFILTQLQLAESPLRSLLRVTAKNTQLELPTDGPYAGALSVIPQTFAFVKALAPQPGGPMPAFDAYVTQLRAMQAELNGEPPPAAPGAPPAAAAAPDPKAPPPNPNALEKNLSPVGKMALAIFLQKPTSAEVKIQTWLSGLQVPPQWWGPFLEPARRIYQQGVRDVENTVAGTWGKMRQKYLSPLTTKFPFARNGDAVATAADLNPLGPKKAFWSDFDAGIAPVMVKTVTGWAPREAAGRSVTLPPDLVGGVASVVALDGLLWSADGKPQPLELDVRPLPLPQPVADPDPSHAPPPLVLAEFLHVGSQMVTAFNQRSDWSTLKLDWWKSGTSAVGAAFASGKTGRVYRNDTVMEVQWSFFRLLAQAELTSTDGHIYAWQVRGPLDGQSVTEKFQLQGDPWKTFELQ